MLEVKLKDHSALLPDTGTRRVLPFIGGYYKQLIATTLIRKLEQLPAQFNGDLYDGEAEQMIYRPLAQWLKTTLEVRANGQTAEDDVIDWFSFPQFCFQSAVDYAVIHEFFKVQLANRITSTEAAFVSVKDSLIFEAMSEVDKEKTSYNMKKVAWTANPAGAESLTAFYKAIMPDSGIKVLDAVTNVVAKSTKAITDDVDAYDKSLATKIDELKKYLRRGKGAPATIDQRVTLLTSRMQVIDSIIKLLAPTAGIRINDNPCTKSDFYDGVVTAIYFFEYLQIQENYDVQFPYQPPNGNAFAYSATLTSQARNLAGKFMRFYDLPIKVDLYQAINMLNMAVKPYETVMDNYFPTWRAESQVYRDYIDAWIPEVDSCLTVFWDETVRRQMAFGDGAELIVDMLGITDSLKEAATRLAGATGTEASVTIQWDKSTCSWMIDGEQLTDKFVKYPVLTPGTISERVKVSSVVHVPLDRQVANKIYLLYMDAAQALMTTIAITKESKTLGNRLTTAFEASTDKITIGADYWQFMPLMGSLKEAAPAPFKMIDPLSRVYTPWYLKVNDKSVHAKWKLQDWMYRIIHYRRVNDALMNSVDDIFTWDQSNYPQDDAITLHYVNGLIPAAYTRDRRRDWAPYSIHTLLDRLQTGGGFHDDYDFYGTAALTLDTLESDYVSTVLDALAANVLVYKCQDVKDASNTPHKDEKYSLLSPQLPVLWTVPTLTFIENQKDSEGKERGKVDWDGTMITQSVNGAVLAAMKKADLASCSTIKHPVKGRTKYVFALHTHFPAPTLTFQRLWKARYKTYIPVFISELVEGAENKPIVKLGDLTIKNSVAKSYDTTSGVTEVKKYSLVWLEAGGWSILQNPWPHINAQCKTLNLGWLEWSVFQNVDVFIKENQLMRSLDFRAKLLRDATVLDDEDEATALSFPDPDWTTEGRTIPPYNPEVVRLGDTKKAFITGEAGPPDHAAPRGTGDDHRSMDLIKAVWTPVFTLSESGLIKVRGGMASADDFYKSILAGATYIDEPNDTIVGFSETHHTDLEQVSSDPEQAAKQINDFLGQVKAKKAKNDDPKDKGDEDKKKKKKDEGKSNSSGKEQSSATDASGDGTDEDLDL